jgi:hypothetical protein
LKCCEDGAEDADLDEQLWREEDAKDQAVNQGDRTENHREARYECIELKRTKV